MSEYGKAFEPEQIRSGRGVDPEHHKPVDWDDDRVTGNANPVVVDCPRKHISHKEVKKNA